MQDEFDVMTGTVTPTLSFGVQPEPELPAEKKPEEVKPAEPVDDSILSDEEMDTLLGDLLRLQQPNYTPSGKTIICMMPIERIASMFN